MSFKKESINVLQECIELQTNKSNDYQNPNSVIRQADYYPNGCQSIFDSMHSKVLRMRSVMEAMSNDPNYKPNFESLEDSAKDLINYASFFVSYMRGKIDGQDSSRDWLNKKINTIPEMPKAVRDIDGQDSSRDWFNKKINTIPEIPKAVRDYAERYVLNNNV